VQPGNLTTFERIEVVGNEKTRDKVIRRELRIYEGERFSGTGLRHSRQRVNALGFFETVEVTTRRGSAEDQVIATVEVKERPTGTFQVGAGFSSYENFILTGQISQQNFFGWGQTLSLQIQWSSVRQLGQIQFVEPYFLDTRFSIWQIPRLIARLKAGRFMMEPARIITQRETALNHRIPMAWTRCWTVGA
jgi:outer membrane protein insertion porin family